MSDIASKIKGLIYENGLNMSKVARGIHMKEVTLINKFNRGSLKSDEIEKICKFLKYNFYFVKDS